MTRDRIAGALCLIGAALVLIACIGHRWGTVEVDREVAAIGLLDANPCAATPDDDDLDPSFVGMHRRQYRYDGVGECEPVDHGTDATTRIEGKQFARAGQAGFVLAILTAVLAAMAAAPRMRRRVRRFVTVGGALAIATLGAFAILEPFSLRTGPWHPGIAWWLALGGMALAIGGAQLDAPERPGVSIAAIGLVFAAGLLAVTARGVGWWMLEREGVSIAIGPAMVHGCDGDACSWSRFGELVSDGKAHASGLAITTGRVVAIGAGVAAALAAALAIALAARRRARLLVWLVLATTAVTAIAIAAFAMQVSSDTLAPHVVGDLGRGLGLPLAIAGVLAAMAAAVIAQRGPLVTSAPLDALAPTPEVVTIPDPPRADEAHVPSEPIALAPTIAPPVPTAPAPIAITPAAPPIAPRAPTPAPIPIPRAATAQTPSGPIPAAAPPCPTCRTPMLWVSKRQLWLCVSCRRGGTAA